MGIKEYPTTRATSSGHPPDSSPIFRSGQKYRNLLAWVYNMPCGAWPCIVGSRANDEYWWILTIFEKGEWYIIEWKLKNALKVWIQKNPFWSVSQPAVTAFGTRNLGETTPRTGCNCLDCWWRLGGLRWENTRDEEYWCLNGIDYDSDSSGMFMTALGIPVLLSRKNTIATNILPIGPVGMELSIKKNESPGSTWRTTRNGCKSACTMYFGRYYHVLP